MTDRVQQLRDIVQATTKAHDPEAVIDEASSPDNMKRLGEMRLIAVRGAGGDDYDVLGMTALGRRVLIGLLGVLGTTTTHTELYRMTGLVAAYASRVVAFDDLPDVVKEEFARYADERRGLTGGGDAPN